MEKKYAAPNVKHVQQKLIQKNFKFEKNKISRIGRYCRRNG